MKFSDHFIDQRVIIRAGGAPQTQPIVVAARNATPRDRSWLTFSGQVWRGGAVSTEHRVAETTTFSTSRPSNRRRLRRQLVRNVHFHMVGNIHLDRQPRTSRRREAQTGSRARSGSRSERTLDAVEHSRTLMEWWPFLIFHRGGLRIKVINNTRPTSSELEVPTLGCDDHRSSALRSCSPSGYEFAPSRACP